MDKVSVIVPAYNVGDYLRQCIDSICYQTYKNLEIIIVNDGSTDNTKQLIQSYAKKDKRIIAKNQINLGHGPACNLGIKNATSRYLMFCDGDDYYFPTMVEELLQAINKRKTPVVTSQAYAFDAITKKSINDSNHTSIPISKKHQQQMHRQEIIQIADQLPIQYWAKIYNRQWLVKNKILFSNEKTSYDDIPFHWHILAKTQTLGIVPKKLYAYRVNRQGSSFDKINVSQFTNMHNHAAEIVKVNSPSLLSPFYKSYIQAIEWLFLHAKITKPDRIKTLKSLEKAIQSFNLQHLLAFHYQVFQNEQAWYKVNHLLNKMRKK